jgi:spermidine synthase
LGALLAAFYLIPWVGLTTSLRVFAVLSVLFAFYFFSKKRRPAALLALAVCSIFPQPTYQWITDRTLLEQREGYYQTIRVYSDENQFMYFHLGPTYEAVVDLRTGQPGLSYARTMLALMEYTSGKEVLIIGGAGHALARSLEARGAVVTEVEIDPFVVEVSDAYFGPIQGDVVVQDGRIFVDWAESDRFDYVILDAFNGVHYIPPQLVTREFFQNASRVLKPGGKLLINFIGTPSGPRSNSFRSLSTTLSTVFSDVRASHTRGDLMRNIVVVASQDEMPGIDFENVPTDGWVLTDDLNPIEIFLLQARDKQVFCRRMIK